MSFIGTPEIPGAYGAIDSASAAFEDGNPFSADILREFVRSANRLASKGQHLFCLPFLIEQAADPDANPDGFIIPAPSVWTRIHPPISCPKKAGLTRGQVRVHARIEGSVEIQMAIATRAAPFNPQNPIDRDNIFTLAGDGDGDVDEYGSDLDSPGIPLDISDFEEIEIWIRTSEVGTSVYNATDSANTAEVGPTSLSLPDASWADQAWPGRAHIEFYDANEGLITRRDISSVNSIEETVYWDSPLPGWRIDEINDSIANNPGDPWRILVRTSDFALVSFAMMAVARTA